MISLNADNVLKQAQSSKDRPDNSVYFKEPQV